MSKATEKETKGKFDLLFLCHEKDKAILRKNLVYAKKNIIGYRKIFVLSEENFFPENEEVTFISKKIFPFSEKDIGKYAPIGRAGWYRQQFLKLYFFKVLKKKVLDNLLILDADLTFIKKTKFFDGDIPLYNFEIGYHDPYYEIMGRVLGFGKQNPKLSATVHHMVYQRKYIKELLNINAKKNGKEFWKMIMENIDKKTISGICEQEVYFNYMLKFHSDKIKVRRLKFIDFPYNSPFWISFFRFFGYSYIACHHYLREERFSAIRRLGIEILKLFGLKIWLKKVLIKLKVLKVK